MTQKKIKVKFVEVPEPTKEELEQDLQQIGEMFFEVDKKGGVEALRAEVSEEHFKELKDGQEITIKVYWSDDYGSE